MIIYFVVKSGGVGVYWNMMFFRIDTAYYQFTLSNKFNPYPAKLIYLNFQALEVVSRYRDSQP